MEPITPHAFSKLGGIRRTPNPKDYLVGGATAPVYNFPQTKAKPVNRTHYFQGKQAACGAHAGVALVDSLMLQQGVTAIPNHTPRDLWIEIKTDGTAVSDGTTMDRIFAELKSVGVIPFEPLENNVTYDPADYAEMDVITSSIKEQEGKNLIESYAYPTDLSFNGIKQAIDNFGAVILLIDVCERFWTAANGVTSWAAKDILPLAPPSAAFPVVDGHFIVLDYYDEQYLYGPNSFGTTWGLDGDLQMGINYMPFVLEMGIVRLPATVQAVSQVTPQVLDTVAQSIPQVQNAIGQLQNLPQAEKIQHETMIQEWIDDLKALL